MVRYIKSNSNNNSLDTDFATWYQKNYPTDPLGKELAPFTFREALEVLKENGAIYDIMGNGSDSIIRERLFAELSKRLGVPYDVLYYLWMDNGVEGEHWEKINGLLNGKDIFSSKRIYADSDSAPEYDWDKETGTYVWHTHGEVADVTVKRDGKDWSERFVFRSKPQYRLSRWHSEWTGTSNWEVWNKDCSNHHYDFYGSGALTEAVEFILNDCEGKL